MLAPMVIDEIRTAVEGGGYDLAHVEWKGGRGRAVLRVYIESDRGVGISDCERVSREISAILDALDPIETRYTLEVTSTGVERPIFHPDEYEKFIGRAIHVKLGEPINGQHVVKAYLVRDEGSAIRVRVGSEEHRIEKSAIRESHLLGPWKEVD